MRCLITGANGRLGRALVERAVVHPDLTVLAFGKDRLDITSPTTLTRTLNAYRPDWVLNAAAVTRAVPDRLYEYERVNAQGAGALAVATAGIGAKLVHISTDYVFSGAGEAPWCERDRPAAIGVYGRSKEEGEYAVLRSGVTGYLLRAGWLHSGENDFVAAILEKALRGDVLQVVTTQVGKPSETSAFAEWIWRVLTSCSAPSYMDIEHYVEAGDYVSRFDEAKVILEAASRLDTISERAARWQSALERMIPLETLMAGQPANCRLICGKDSPVAEIPRVAWRKGVDNSVIKWLSQNERLWITHSVSTITPPEGGV